MDKGETQTNEPEKKGDDDTQCLTFERWHRLYVLRKERGLVSINRTSGRLYYEERLITATSKSTDNIKTNRTKKLGKRNGKMYGYFKRQTSEISHKKTLTWLRKGNLKTVTETLLIAAQNMNIRTNYIKVNIDNRPQNSQCWL